jgi:hypothetical protein
MTVMKSKPPFGCAPTVRHTRRQPRSRIGES